MLQPAKNNVKRFGKTTKLSNAANMGGYSRHINLLSNEKLGNRLCQLFSTDEPQSSQLSCTSKSYSMM